MGEQSKKSSAKKWITYLLAAVMVMGLAYCGGNNKENNSAATETGGFNKEGLPIVSEPADPEGSDRPLGQHGRHFYPEPVA